VVVLCPILRCMAVKTRLVKNVQGQLVKIKWLVVELIFVIIVRNNLFEIKKSIINNGFLGLCYLQLYL